MGSALAAPSPTSPKKWASPAPQPTNGYGAGEPKAIRGCMTARWMDRRRQGSTGPTGQIVRRYERSRPGELVHVDIKKLGNIPDGGGHRIMPRQQAAGNRQATTDARRGGSPVIGYRFVHTAGDDHSRLACSEVLTDERKETAASFQQRANTFFAEHGITVERVLTDNGSCYRSRCSARLSAPPTSSIRARAPIARRRTARWSA